MSGKTFLRAAPVLTTLLRYEYRQDLKKRYVVFGHFIYIGMLLLLIRLLLPFMDISVWQTLFWLCQMFIILYFTQTNLQKEKEGHRFFYYLVTLPALYLTAKIIYRSGHYFLLTVCNILGFYTVLTPGAPYPFGSFLPLVFIGSLNLCILFTFLSCLAAHTENAALMISLLGLPLLLPLLLILRNATVHLPQLPLADYLYFLALLTLFSGLIFVMALILFKYLWYF